MSELDEKLNELSIFIEANRDVSPATWESEIWPLIKDKFKQAFVDDGWVRLNVKPGDFITVNAGTVVLNGDGTITPVVRMTGQEFYDRFVEAYPAWQGFISKDYNDGFANSRMGALEAAKRAAGIEP